MGVFTHGAPSQAVGAAASLPKGPTSNWSQGDSPRLHRSRPGSYCTGCPGPPGVLATHHGSA